MTIAEEINGRRDSCFVIAEAGVNHNGRVEDAMKLIDAAVAAGADAVKFQTFRPETLVVTNAAKADYQKETTGNDGTQFEMLQTLMLSPAAHLQLMDHCRQGGIGFLSSPFSVEDILFLHEIGVRTYKVPSGEITNYPYLKKMGSIAEEVILSTGMSNMEEIRDAIDVLTEAGLPESSIILLHCNTAYPTPYEDANLRAMASIREAFGLRTGYSDHTVGIDVAIAAAALGAVVIEKHFTLDKEAVGPDHRASLCPEELTRMIAGIRNIKSALGSPAKELTPSERVNRDLIRKKIVARKLIRKGDVFTESNLTAKRTQSRGISPMMWESIIGTRAERDFLPDEAIW